MIKDVLVVGGGIAGMQASLDLADMGIKVHMVEKLPSIGGKMAQLDKTFPTKMLDVGRHPKIDLLAYSEVEKVEGQAGDFKVTVRKKARYVEESKCTGCGTCSEKCPTIVSDAFNEGLGTRTAVYAYFAQGIPSTRTIDPDHCRQLNGKKCGICQKVCQADAINFDQQDQILELDVGAVIIAAGYDVFDPSLILEYRYQEIPNVVTAIELERLLSASGPTGGHLDRPSDLAVKAEIETLEKKIKKSSRAVGKFE